MFKLISITAIAVAALLVALPGMGTTMQASSDEPAAAAGIPPRKILAMAGEFHARLILNASRSLDADVRRVYCDDKGEERIALAGAGKPARAMDVSAR